MVAITVLLLLLSSGAQGEGDTGGIKESAINQYASFFEDSPTGSNSFQLCEHAKQDSKKLSCKNGYEIKITRALYGRKSSSICPHISSKNVRNCGKDELSLKTAQKECDRKESCVLKAKNSMFGDPCWTVVKYLDVTYSCVLKNSKEYKLTFKTSGYTGGGTAAKVYVVLEGDQRTSGKIPLRGAYNAFYRNQVAKFTVHTPDVGKVLKMRIGHDNTGSGPAWYPVYVSLATHDACKIMFPVNRWLQTGSLEATVFPVYDKKSCANVLGAMRTYIITVKTSDVTYGSTGAKVYIMLNGKTSSTGYQRLVKSSTHKNPFIRNNKDIFTIQAADVGNDIKSMRITHDVTGKGSGWKVDYVTVTPKDTPNCRTDFRVNQWITGYNLDVERYPSFSDKLCGDDVISYEITTQMSKKSGAGTNSKVYIIIYGENGDTGKLFLVHAKKKGNEFASGRQSIFKGKGPNVGKVTRVKIGLDDLKKGEMFLLTGMGIVTETCSYKFSNMKWLDQISTTDLYPTLVKCKDKEPTSKGAICSRDFLKIGCYKRDWEKVPDLLVTDLDPTHKNFTTEMNWEDFVMGLHSLACRCRAKAAGHYKYFAIGFHGECVSGQNTAGLEKMFKADEGDGCVDGNYETCTASSNECAGLEDYDFFYKVVNW